MVAAALSLDNPIFRMFLGYAGVVLVKTSLMSPLTAFYRMTRKAFANEEDTASFGGPRKVPVNTSHPAVEHVRRCHLNDLENVVPFVLLGILYCASGPTQWAAMMHFRIFTISRLLHTCVYVLAVPQPARALAFFAGFLVNLSMAYNVILQGAFCN